MAASSTKCLDVSEVRDGVAELVLNRPGKKNALSIELRDAISDALDHLAQDDEVRAVIVAAAGDTFCAGFDLGEFEVDDPGFQRRLWESADRFHQCVLRFPLPTVAAVQGAALAGGFDLAVLCDIRIAATTARFAHPEQSWSDVVFSPLADLVGSARARDLCMTGRGIDAPDALHMGIVSAVIEPDALIEEARRVAAMIARAPRPPLMRTKAKALQHSGIAAHTTTLEL
jgi:enoyl-CoA hydratase/carnithine racemase